MRTEIPQLNASARVAAWLFLRGLAVVYFIAFSSLLPQIAGLIGERGILPAHDFLNILGQGLGGRAFFAVPSVFWAGVSDGTLQAGAWIGTALSVLLFLDVAPALALALLWFLYLSIVSVGQDFFSFQWDGLLLEAGLLAVLLAPWRLWPKFGTLPLAPAFPLFLLRWLLFRFMLLNGLVKLASGDTSWRDLSALSYHYFTQPLPSPLSWFFFHLPLWFHQGSAVLLFIVELALPLCILGNHVTRRIACGGIVALQVVILLTGNLSFLNGLTLVLALLLLDDGCFERVNALERVLSRPFRLHAAPVRRAVTLGLGGLLLFWSAVVSVERLGGPLPGWIDRVGTYVNPWRSVNGYGLFPVMTKSRGEIAIEGSDDGKSWKEYGFRYKPQDPKRMPAWVAPYQPRLDWQMWFAALTSGERAAWFQNLLVRLLQGSPDVLRLFAADPFPDAPPRYVRAMFYNYRFTTPEEHAATGDWWKVAPAGWYYPTITLNTAPATTPAGTP